MDRPGVGEALVAVLGFAVCLTFQLYCQRCQRRRVRERFSTIQNTRSGVRELRRVIDRGTPYPLNQVQRPDPVNHRGVLGAPLWIQAPQVQEPPVQAPPVQEPPVPPSEAPVTDARGLRAPSQQFFARLHLLTDLLFELRDGLYFQSEFSIFFTLSCV